MTIALKNPVFFGSPIPNRPIFLFVFSLAFVAGCGRSVSIREMIDSDIGARTAEVCDGMDNNLNGEIDEEFRNDAGLYVHNDHCGACNQPCGTNEVTLETTCRATEFGGTCRSTKCIDGYVPTESSTCVRKAARLCAPCLDNGDCGGFADARCANIAGESRCSVACDSSNPCPSGYRCSPAFVCVPPSNSCSCHAGDNFSLACTIEVNGEKCLGESMCENGILSPCAGSQEICDGLDNDCNGKTDDPFVNANGFYSVDVRNCGSCGVDCTLNPIPEKTIACAGPATSPVCSILCRDTLDGIDVGDAVDADLLIHNECECIVVSLDDEPEPAPASGSEIDSNCDGFDGVVANSFYVLPGGDDLGPGSPIEPMGSIGAAVEAAYASLESNNPRPFVFVAAGSYDEVLTIEEGVRVYGGYSPDFKARDPKSYLTEIHPKSWQAAPGGAALIAENVGVSNETIIDGVILEGASAPGGKENYAFGAYVRDSGEHLHIANSVIMSGDGSDGESGKDGAAGLPPSVDTEEGALPRASIESPSHRCTSENPANTVRGGVAGFWTCGGINVSGGKGGDSGCPGDTLTSQPDGNPGNGPAETPGGEGGTGGSDAQGPIFGNDGSGCPANVCCDLADFIVDGSYKIAGDGDPGKAGTDGNGGAGCADSLGAITNSIWISRTGKSGSSGSPGSGGGGGGAGGGATIEWVPDACPFPDGLGGGGGAGGGGGCGGSGGNPGTSGGPSIGLLLTYSDSDAISKGAPEIKGVTFSNGNGGDGGHGGHGGDGGQGGPGAKGGALLPTERITPPLAGATSGGDGGSGGGGGAGGGGGGGCGGPSLGIWVDANGESLGSAILKYNLENIFSLGKGGSSGTGGGGGNYGQAGKNGRVRHVVER